MRTYHREAGNWCLFPRGVPLPSARSVFTFPRQSRSALAEGKGLLLLPSRVFKTEKRMAKTPVRKRGSSLLCFGLSSPLLLLLLLLLLGPSTSFRWKGPSVAELAGDGLNGFYMRVLLFVFLSCKEEEEETRRKLFRGE